MSNKNRWLIFGVICVLAASQLACVLPAAMRGGGWLPSGDKKATLGFQVTCDKDTGDVHGQFQWYDHGRLWEGKKVAAHGVMDYNLEGCETGDIHDVYEGTYWPQPKNLGDGGKFKYYPETDTPPCFEVVMLSGVYEGYQFRGCLDGGNIRVWEQED